MRMILIRIWVRQIIAYNLGLRQQIFRRCFPLLTGVKKRGTIGWAPKMHTAMFLIAWRAKIIP